MKTIDPPSIPVDYKSIILDNVYDVIITSDLNFNVQFWNKSAEEYYGIPAANAVGKRMFDLVDFTFHNTTLEDAAKEVAANGVWKGEVSFINKAGEKKNFFHTVKFIFNRKGEKIGFVSTGRDISEIRFVKESLKQSELFYRTLFANSLDVTLLVSATGIITFVTPVLKRVLGYDMEEVVGKVAFDFVHPEDAMWAVQSFQREVAENPEIKFIHIRLKKKDGSWLWCMVRGHNLLNNPHINSIVVYFHDDTFRKTANDALKASEKQVKNLISDLQIGILLQDKQGNAILSNKAFREIFKKSEEELTGKNIVDIVIDPIHENGKKYKHEERPAIKAINTKKPVRDAVLGVCCPPRKQRTWLLTNADPILDDEGEIIHIIYSVKDISDRKKMEELMLAEKIRHQKQLTKASIDGQEKERVEIGRELHDNIGQQLTTVKLFLDLARSSNASTAVEMLDMASKGVMDLINDIRSISRNLVPSTLKDLGLVESVQELIDFTGKAQFTQIILDADDFDDSQLTDHQKVALFRIIQEQLNNIVKHSNARTVRIRLTRQCKNISLQLQDDGDGFDASTVKKGLGLSTIRNRAEILGGEAEFQSAPGKGCTMKVLIPFEMEEV